MFNKMFKFFTENDLISVKPSAFTPGDFCVNQLVSVTHEIYKSFDEGHELVCFRDISKAFDNVWHDGIICKLTQKRNIRKFTQAFPRLLSEGR